MKKISIFLTTFLLLSGFFIANPTPTYADEIDQQLQAAGGQTGLGQSDPRATTASIIKAVMGAIGIIFVGLMVYAGFLWMTAGGEEERVNKSKSLITQAIIGLIIVLLSYSITFFVFKVGMGKEDAQYYRNDGTGIQIKF